MFSKAYFLQAISTLLLSLMPQLEVWLAALLTMILGALQSWARNHAVGKAIEGEPTKASPITGKKSAWKK